jgi:hypothetical protein
MSLHDQIEALGNEISDGTKAVLHAIALAIESLAPVAEVVETAAGAPEAAAVTQAVDVAAEGVEKTT